MSNLGTTDAADAVDKAGKCLLDNREVEVIIKGLAYATLAATNDDEGDMERLQKSYPWQTEAFLQITGDAEHSDRGLSHLLKTYFGMELDCHINVSGYSSKGCQLGVQGYIAHNEKSIVLAYSSKKSIFQWVEEMDYNTSEWIASEQKQNIKTGILEEMLNSCTSETQVEPTVHAGFYSNFQASLPLIKKYIEPLLAPDQARRSVFIVGDSVGGGVASLATCHFLLEFDWKQLPHKLVSVTGGSPRCCSVAMKSHLDERRRYLGDSVHLFRVVQDDDIVPIMPSKAYGYEHMCPAIRIGEDGGIFKDPEELPASKPVDNSCDFMTILNQYLGFSKKETNKEVVISQIPKSLRSHNPSAYMAPFLRAKGVGSVSEMQLKSLAPTTTAPVATKVVVSGPKLIPRLPAIHTPRIKAAPMIVAKQANWFRKPKVRMPMAPNANKKKQMNSIKATNQHSTKLSKAGGGSSHKKGSHNQKIAKSPHSVATAKMSSRRPTVQ